MPVFLFATLDDAKKLYSGFDLNPMTFGFDDDQYPNSADDFGVFMNAAIDQNVEKSQK